MAPDTNPSSWRDVYSLVRDSRADVLEAVAAVDRKVEGLAERVSTIEDDRLIESGRRRATDKAFGVARSTIAIAVSVISAITAVAAMVTK